MGKVEATLRAAERLGATVLLKGEATVLADHRGASAIQSALYDRKAPWLGTAGAGDVLAGLITGLSTAQMAQISYAIDLAAVAAWLHVECARSFGPGLIAEDLPEQLPKVFTELGF
jgi:NAD(P)H-hydrate repair Nnr-like enzyme with NAD(P)H-hydrate dehydratase domain